jgi:hypothetical protein
MQDGGVAAPLSGCLGVTIQSGQNAGLQQMRKSKKELENPNIAVKQRMDEQIIQPGTTCFVAAVYRSTL